MIHAKAQKDTLMIDPQAVTNTQTVTAILDTKGSDFATIRLALQTELNTNAVGPTISILSSDDTVVTNAVTMIADRSAEDITAAKEIRWEIDCRNEKRYIRLKVNTATATNDDITVCAFGSLSRNEIDPNTTTEMGDDVVVEL